MSWNAVPGSYYAVTFDFGDPLKRRRCGRTAPRPPSQWQTPKPPTSPWRAFDPSRGRLGDDAFTRATTVCPKALRCATHEDDAGAQRRGICLPDAKTRIVGLAERLRAKEVGAFAQPRAWLRARRRRHRSRRQLPHPTSAANFADRAGARRHRGRLHPGALLDGRRHSHEEVQALKFGLGRQPGRCAPAPKKVRRARPRALEERRQGQGQEGQRRDDLPRIATRARPACGKGSLMLPPKNLRLAVGVPLALIVSLGVVTPGQAKDPETLGERAWLHHEALTRIENPDGTFTRSAHAGRSARCAATSIQGWFDKSGYRAKRQKFTYVPRERSTRRRTWLRFCKGRATKGPIRPGLVIPGRTLRRP